MRGALFAVEDARNRATLDGHPVSDRAAGVLEQCLDGQNRVAKRSDQFVDRGHEGIGKRHGRLR